MFRAKTRALEKALHKAFPPARTSTTSTSIKPVPGSLPQYPGGIQLIYTTAPHALEPHQIPGFITSEGGETGESDDIEAYGWWRKDESSGLYTGLSEGLDVVANAITEAGGIDAVVGFSQGGAMAALVASLLERDRYAAFASASQGQNPSLPFPESFQKLVREQHHPPLAFFISYSGFFAPHALYMPFYSPPICTPSLHFIGSLDTVVEESRTLGLFERCAEASRVKVVHPGGHFVPVGREWVGVVAGWIRGVVGADAEKSGKEEESVEDMDMPF
jgi:hypothetical protein